MSNAMAMFDSVSIEKQRPTAKKLLGIVYAMSSFCHFQQHPYVEIGTIFAISRTALKDYFNEGFVDFDNSKVRAVSLSGGWADYYWIDVDTKVGIIINVTVNGTEIEKVWV
jgi:hypothetical protein